MKRCRVPRRSAVSLLVVALTGCLVGGTAVATTGHASKTKGQPSGLTVGPSGLKFYSPKRLPAGPHGTLIWERPFKGVAALKGATNSLVLYKQVGVSGKPVAVSGIVSVPKGTAPKGGWPVVTWAHGTTGIAPQCAPSRDTGPSSGAYTTDIGTAPLFNTWIKDGYAVVRTDYEGLGGPGVHPYLIGRSEGDGVLDIVRAARQLDPAVSNRMIIAGHSQGGHAALWAASLAPRYTPDLQLLGTVPFAPQSHTAVEATLFKNLTITSLTGLSAMIVRGLQVAYPSQNVSALLSPAALKLYPQTLTTCLGGLDKPDSFGSLPLNQLFSPSADETTEIKDLKANDPDALKIKGPVLIEQGLADTTVIPTFDQQLSQELAKNGAKVTYHTYPGVTHGGVIVAGAKDATAFLKKHFGKG
jgi:pimeloyl-ACP methyl ester carboxylesterase